MTIEIGRRLGNLKRRLPQIITTDIRFAPRLEKLCVKPSRLQPVACDSRKGAKLLAVDTILRFTGRARVRFMLRNGPIPPDLGWA